MAGETTTGTSVFQLVPELDAGDVFAMEPRSIGADETAGDLLSSLAVSGAAQLVTVVDSLAEGTAESAPQPLGATLAPKLTLSDGLIDWGTDAVMVSARLRGVTPEPGAFTTVDGARLKVLDARVAAEFAPDAAPTAPGELRLDGRRLLIGTTTDPIELITVHPEGRKPMAATDWWRGRPANSGTVAE